MIGNELANQVRDVSIALYKRAAEYALTKGIIIADTKFEFGLDDRGHADADGRGADARLLALLAGRRLRRGPEPAQLRQAVRARLARVACASTASRGTRRRRRRRCPPRSASARPRSTAKPSNAWPAELNLLQHMSRLIDRLDAQIAQAEEVFERECLKSRRAAVLARHGQFAEARFALAGLRSQSQRLRNPVLSAWVAFVDGLIEHCESLAPTARAKFQRAYDLASTAGDAELHALMRRLARDGRLQRQRRRGHRRARARGAAHRAGRQPRRARPRRAGGRPAPGAWPATTSARSPGTSVARQHAATEGDVSLVSVLLHNMAAFQAGRISLEGAFDRADLADAQRVLLEAESTGNYDAGVGNGQLMAEVPLLRAQLMTVLGQYDAAIALFDAQLPRARAEGQVHREARFLADAAVRRGEAGPARRGRQAPARDQRGAAADDRARRRRRHARAPGRGHARARARRRRPTRTPRRPRPRCAAASRRAAPLGRARSRRSTSRARGLSAQHGHAEPAAVLVDDRIRADGRRVARSVPAWACRPRPSRPPALGAGLVISSRMPT